MRSGVHKSGQVQRRNTSKDHKKRVETFMKVSRKTLVYWLVTSTTWLYAKLFFRLQVVFDGNEKDFFEKIQDPVIIAPNHVSYIDPPLIGGIWPKPLHFFAGLHLFQKSRFFSWLLKKLHSHPVNRENGAHALKEAIRLVSREKLSIVLFPEGTRSQTGMLQPLQEGVAFIAMKSGAKIIPAYIYGAHQAWPRNAKRPKLFGKIVVHFGRPIDPNEVVLANPEKSSKEVLRDITLQLQRSLEDLEKTIYSVYKA